MALKWNEALCSSQVSLSLQEQTFAEWNAQRHSKFGMQQGIIEHDAVSFGMTFILKITDEAIDEP